jgi:hypothetical protein
MKPAAVGFRVHSGWTAIVAVAIDEDIPLVLARQRAHLVRTFTYEYRQPYHTAATMPADARETFVSRVRAEAKHLAFRAICRFKRTLGKEGYCLTSSGLLLASGRPLPELTRILASHSLIHAADGELFRDAILDATSRCGLLCTKVKEKDLLDSAARTLGLGSRPLSRRIRELGRRLGPPWSQDEKYASLVAWLAAAESRSARSSARAVTRGRLRQQSRRRLQPTR